jgi:hypothetical protein
MYAGVTIPDDRLFYFKEKRIRIFSHADNRAREALQRWAVNDLNDLSKIDYDNWEANRVRIESIMDF